MEYKMDMKFPLAAKRQSNKLETYVPEKKLMSFFKLRNFLAQSINLLFCNSYFVFEIKTYNIYIFMLT